ncbi:hypothetical protein Dimus_010014 [Dionaea muscipula]
MGNFFGLIRASETSSSEDVVVPGLRNLGNNCFLNVILQALASCVSFRIFLSSNIESLESLHVEKQDECFPLLYSLASLLEDLCTLQDRSITLSPLKVMSAMDMYTSHFDLTAQQDAAESFLHLLSCLREEFSESYVSGNSSLTDVAGPSGRIVSSYMREEDTSEPMRWRKQFIGPFDGISCSRLSCQSCGTEIIMDFEFFHTLPLSPTRAAVGSIVVGCTVEDCLNRFMAAERVENYDCSHCWHAGAIKYLALMVEEHEKEREKLSRCNKRDSCDCRNMSCLQALPLPWSNHLSHAIKQLTIACYPKILCLHIQRTSVNGVGQLVKLEGHIPFPLFLNMSRFVKDVDAGIQLREEHNLRRDTKLIYQPGISHPNHINIGPAQMDEKISKSTAQAYNADTCGQFQSPDKVRCLETPSADGPVYHLVSVVEHFGTAGGGHYAVYRRVMAEIDDGDNDRRRSDDQHAVRWLSISDARVNPASEEDVLAADATLLFYERSTDHL